MVEAMRGGLTSVETVQRRFATIENIRKASREYLGQAETRVTNARDAWMKSNPLFQLFRPGKAGDIRREDLAALRHRTGAEEVAQTMSGVTFFRYEEEPEVDGLVKWDLEIVSDGKKIRMGVRHFLGRPVEDKEGGHIVPRESKPYVRMGRDVLYGDDRFDVTRRFKKFIDELKAQGVIGTKIKVGSKLSLPGFDRLKI